MRTLGKARIKGSRQGKAITNAQKDEPAAEQTVSCKKQQKDRTQFDYAAAPVKQRQDCKQTDRQKNIRHVGVEKKTNIFSFPYGLADTSGDRYFGEYRKEQQNG